MTSRAGRTRLILSASTAVVLLSGCGADGPAEVRDGEYRFLTASTPGSTGGSTLSISGDTLTVTSDAGETTATIGAESAQVELCPGGGTGRPERLDGSLELGGIRLAAPAVFGDCGVTTPVRVTIVDLDAPGDGRPPYASWVEFCLASDPDCPS